MLKIKIAQCKYCGTKKAYESVYLLNKCDYCDFTKFTFSEIFKINQYEEEKEDERFRD